MAVFVCACKSQSQIRQFSTLDGEDKKAALAEFERRWTGFTEYVVAEYGQ